MSGRCLDKLLRSSNCRLTRATPSLSKPRRTFTSSTTCQKHGAVPVFPEVSTPELNGLLSTMRETVFLPAHLTRLERKLVFDERKRKSLAEYPVKVNVGGEEFTLKHIDRTTGQPNTRKALFEIIELMQKSDWNALPVLLEGLHTSGRKLKPDCYEKIIRKAALASRQDIIVECARMVSRTGFQLKDLNVVRQIFFWIQYGAIPEEGKTQTLQNVSKALVKAEHVALLLEDEKHSGGARHGDVDPRIRPEVIGVLLQLSAMRASLSGGKDTDGKVDMYAQRLLSTLGRHADLRQGISMQKEWMVRSVLLCYLAPMIQGMREAVKILEPGSKTVLLLEDRIAALSKMADEERALIGKESPEGSLPLGAWCYDKLLTGDQKAALEA